MTPTRAREQERTASRQQEKPQIREKDASGKCPHCGAALDRPDYEICPVCGGKLVDYCTFCGAPMHPDDVDCPECGMPSDGVECPACHIRNFRPFCRQCGQPLSKAARRAVEKAKEDLETRKLLDRAKGILMDQHGFSEHDAFQAMQHLSMDRRLSLKAVAQAVIAAAEINGRQGKTSRRRVRN